GHRGWHAVARRLTLQAVGKVLIFIVLPLLETFLLAKIGAAIGWANTLALMILTVVAGVWLTRLEGARAWREWQRSRAAGRMPHDGVLSGVLLLLGGALLILPGVITDVAGLLLLLPPTRRALAAVLRPWIKRRFFEGPAAGAPQIRV